MAYEQPEPHGLDGPDAVPGGVGTVRQGAGLSPDIAALIEADERKKQIAQEAEYQALKIQGRKAGEKAAEKAELSLRRVKLTSLEGVAMQRTFWLWRNRVPLGEITLVAGRGGIGKSLLLCTMTAWITTGTMKGQFYGNPRDVIFVANEDSYERTVIPRLAAAGADLARVHRVDLELVDGEAGKLKLPLDCDVLGDAVATVNGVAVFLDPLSSNMMDRDRNSPEVRQSYERLRQFAEDANVAVIGNAHTRKGQSADLLEAIMGSSEIGNVARAALGVVRDPDSEEPRIIVSQCKNNYGPIDLASYTYTIKEVEIVGQGFAAPVVVWGEDSERHVNDILSEPTGLVSQSDIKECTDWLREFLEREGPTQRPEVMKEALKEGYKEHTVKRAAGRVGVVTKRGSTARPGTTWELKAGSAGSVGTVRTGGVPTVPTASQNIDSAPPRSVPTVPTDDVTQDTLGFEGG